ncbi:hypothetical protein BKA62DRAFT_833147 [Auriculariales sp. MPI-PUGE-AT-0066]|nr:hypothetical protein BKA62DRAFT_833147 [Auriculariales sp. MPI-PUGE-AT-0066]
MSSKRPSTFFLSAAALLAISASVSAIPAGRVEERTSLGLFDDVLLFDSPAVISNSSRVQVQAYTFLRQFDIDLGPITNVLASALGGIDIASLGDKAQNIAERMKVFASIPKSGKDVVVEIEGCGTVTLQPTSSDVDGISVTDVKCLSKLTSAAPRTAQVSLGSREVSARVFPSPIDGFGVISDVDDTIKISNVLDKVKLVMNTFVEEPQPVAGMPALYASLQTSLNQPLFSYISGSPFHLFPFLDEFIGNTYPDGPKFLRNLTIFDLPKLVETLTDKQNTFKHKTAVIDRLVDLYPKKKFVMIGDSTEQDPEIYAAAFARHPASVQCIWVRVVDGADNAAERFATAFAAVPAAKVRKYTDEDIPGLQKINVAGGKC